MDLGELAAPARKLPGSADQQRADDDAVAAEDRGEVARRQRAVDLDGVLVDEGGRTVIPHIYAAGDVARPFGRGRCEHWEPAARMGAAAARSILGLPAAAAPPESFWSDQYGVRIHLVGEAVGADAIEVDGDLDARDFTAVLRRHGALIGALLVGRPRELPTWRRRLAADAQPERIAA